MPIWERVYEDSQLEAETRYPELDQRETEGQPVP